MKVSDRITLLQKALNSGAVRLTLERQEELTKELELLNLLSQKGGSEAELADIYQAGRVWSLAGHEGIFSEEFDARIGSIQIAAQAAGVDMPNAYLEEPASRLMPGALSEVLRDLAATGAGARYAKHLMASADQLDCLQHIFDEMDGQEWSASTLESISGYLSAAGLDIRDIDELEEPGCSGPGM